MDGNGKMRVAKVRVGILTGVLRAVWSTVPAAPPMILIPNPNPSPIFNTNPKSKRK